jgi:hypothetical protein
MVRIRNVGALKMKQQVERGKGTGELGFGVDGNGESRDRGVDG